LGGTDAAASFHHQALTGIDIFGKGCIVGVEKWHIKWLKGATKF
jgi:hypothetical protein